MTIREEERQKIARALAGTPLARTSRALRNAVMAEAELDMQAKERFVENFELVPATAVIERHQDLEIAFEGKAYYLPLACWSKRIIRPRHSAWLASAGIGHAAGRLRTGSQPRTGGYQAGVLLGCFRTITQLLSEQRSWSRFRQGELPPTRGQSATPTPGSTTDELQRRRRPCHHGRCKQTRS